ncbi:MAG: hypothetical protein R3321_05185 [Nitrososphaeraceae archaeon]|nr:hypothetical protein [Nitrososphaeraceae archaeon]
MVQEIFIRENIKTHRIEIIMKEYLGTTKWQSFMFKGVFGNTEAYISSMTPIDGGYIELLKAYIKEDNAA